ncbi:MAG: formate dehydrogenase subunit alpha [Cyclobacteriaceae bacterium]
MNGKIENMAYINGKPFSYVEGETILTFLQRHLGQQAVPTLCDAPNLDPIGACRVCSVEVKSDQHGPAKTVASCHALVQKNSYIRTHSSSIKKLRHNILELVLTDHPLDCLICEANGNCELQTVAAQVGIREVRYPAGKNHQDQPTDTSHPFMVSDLSKCINCYRCIAACDEVQGEFVLSMYGRGFDSRIIKSLDNSFDESDCVACGACAQTCPTAAISDVFKPAAAAVQKTVRTVCTYCGVGCNLEVAVNNGEVLSIAAPYDAEVNQGHACLKGRYAFKFYNHPDRLKAPLIKRNGIFEEVSWNEAYDFIAEKLTKIKERYGPDAIAGISSSRCTNEENYLMQKFMRAVIGTNNIDGCARLCHAPTATGMQRAFGTGAATNSITDLEMTNCILVVGANPTTAHPVTGAKMKQQAIKGKTLIVIDPRETEIARYADYHLQLRPGTNVAVLDMMLHFIVKEGWVDRDFVNERCEGYEEFEKQILQIDIDALEKVSGVNRKLVKAAAMAYAQAPTAMSFHGLGVTEHSQGTFAVMLIADLAMLTGNIGKVGAGVNPLRGQNNVQGAADMGVQPNQGAGYLDVADPAIRKHYEDCYGVPVPGGKGLTIPEMLEASTARDLRALWIMGEHVLQTEPNTDKVEKALDSLDLLIVQELFMTDTAKKAHVVLPGASFLEKSGTFTNGERRVQRVNQVVEPLGNSKPDGQILVDMMNHMGYHQPKYHPDLALKEIAKVVPFFEGIRWDELGIQGKQWPVDTQGKDTKILHSESFKNGKGNIVFKAFKETEELEKHAHNYPFILTTNRELEHYNCGTMTRRTGAMALMDEDVLLVNPKDASAQGWKDGERVEMSSPRGAIEITIRISEAVKSGVVSTTFHFPEVLVNKLASDVCDSEAICPEYKVIAVAIKKIKDENLNPVL